MKNDKIGETFDLKNQYRQKRGEKRCTGSISSEKYHRSRACPRVSLKNLCGHRKI